MQTVLRFGTRKSSSLQNQSLGLAWFHYACRSQTQLTGYAFYLHD